MASSLAAPTDLEEGKKKLHNFILLGSSKRVLHSYLYTENQPSELSLEPEEGKVSLENFLVDLCSIHCDFWSKSCFLTNHNWILTSEPSDLDLLEDRDDEPSELDDLNDEDDSDNDELGEEDMRDASASDEPREDDAAEASDIEDNADEDLMDFGI